MLSEALLKEVKAMLDVKIGKHEELSAVLPVGGGSINHCYRLTYSRKQYFLKVNSATAFPGMFGKEAGGLNILRNTSTIRVPEVIGLGEMNDEAFLVLEWIEAGKNDGQAQAKLGGQLASLHQTTMGYFGLDHDNYIGSLTQSNQKHTSWREFFIQERIEPQLKLAIDKNALPIEMARDFTTLYARLDRFYYEEKPSLIHGDLWSGNYLIAKDSGPYLIDPAIYFGNREMDIAMSTLFGGFPQNFYDGYNAAFPLQTGWAERLNLWNLYPLLVHVSLFGSSYVPQLKASLNRYL